MAESKLKTVSIKFSSRASVQIKGCFYTVEATEERVVPEGIDNIDWEQEKKLLWDSVNDECDSQIEIIFRKSKENSL